MNAKKIIVAGMLLPVMAITSTFASIGEEKHEKREGKRNGHHIKKEIITNAPSEIQELVEKGRNNLTDDEKATIKAYFEQQKEVYIATLPQDVQNVISKRQAGEDLTSEDRQILKDYKQSKREEKKGEFLSTLPEDIRTLVEKGKNNLTDDEKEVVKSYFEDNNIHPPKKKKGGEIKGKKAKKLQKIDKDSDRYTKIQDRISDFPQEVQDALNKVINGDELSDADKQILREFKASRK